MTQLITTLLLVKFSQSLQPLVCFTMLYVYIVYIMSIRLKLNCIHAHMYTFKLLYCSYMHGVHESILIQKVNKPIYYQVYCSESFINILNISYISV